MASIKWKMKIHLKTHVRLHRACSLNGTDMFVTDRKRALRPFHTQDTVCNTESLPRAKWETTIWWRLVVCAHNVEQEDPLCGKPFGVCYHHTE